MQVVSNPNTHKSNRSCCKASSSTVNNQFVVVFVDDEDDGSDGGPEVFAGPGYVQPDPLTCGWRPSGALDQDFGQPSVEGREGLHWLNAGIGE